MTLDEHLAKGYDFYVHGKQGKWTRQMLVDDLESDAEFKEQARSKLGHLITVQNAGRQCEISKVQLRILTDGFAALDAA